MSFNKGRSSSQSSSGSTSSNSGQGQPQDPQRSSRRVRFPLDNNPQTRKIYYPDDEEGSPFHEEEETSMMQQEQPSMRMVRNATNRVGARNSSPLTSPPIVPEESEEDSYFVPRRPSNPNDSPTMFVTRPDNSQVGLDSEYEEDEETTESATDSTRRLISPPPREPNSLLPPEPAASVGPNSLQNLFDVGLHTSGGLAPGAVDYDEALHRQGGIDEEGPTVGDELKRRRDSVLKRIHSLKEKHGTLSRSSSEHSRHRPDEPSGPYGKGSNDGDVPLLELDNKLKKIQEENEDIDTNEMARKLVRSHTLHRHLAKDKSMSLDEKKVEDEKKKKEDETYLVAADDFVTAQNEYDLYGYDGTEGDLPPPADGHYHHDHHEDYVAPPSKVRQGVLGSLLKLYGETDGDKSGNTTPGATTPSGRSTPTSDPGTPRVTPVDGTQVPEATASSTSKRPKLLHTSSASSLFTSSSSKNKEKRPKWYEHKHSRSTSSLGGLVVGASQTLAAPGTNATEGVFKPSRPKFTKRSSGGVKKQKQKLKLEEQIRITVHIADVLQRQRFIIRMCRALMLYGAPTHRLEEYMRMTARVLEINGQFLYIPGCMVISFGDPTTHTTEMQLVRCVQGLNLSKLHKAHQIYKEVVHDVIGVEEASQRVDDLLAAKNQYPVWLTLIFFGLAAASVTPFAFGGYWPDIPISFLLGGLVGVLQLIVAPRSTCYSNVFEVTSSIVVSFLGRAIGSIERNGRQDLFCFASIAQGSLALILPGYIILCGSLELQSKNIVAGSVRMFYAIIYSLFLGFGITLGAAIYGWIDGNATSKTDCYKTCSDWWKLLFVPAFSIFIACVNQASFRQLPVIIFIAGSGYAVTFFINQKVHDSAEFTSAIGAFVIGVLGNMYSRVGHGLAFAAMLPAILVQVPSGIASQGSLVAGIKSADRIVSNGTKPEVITATDAAGTPIATYTTTPTPTQTGGDGFQPNSNVLMLGITMVEVSIGITVGLFVATLVIYPFGKKRSGLFTF